MYLQTKKTGKTKYVIFIVFPSLKAITSEKNTKTYTELLKEKIDANKYRNKGLSGKLTFQENGLKM